MEYNAYEQFGEWIKKQPFWLQDAAWRIYNNKEIGDKEIGTYVQMCVDQAQKKDVTFNSVANSVLTPSNVKPRMAVQSVTNVSNVNALAENTSLIFGEDGVSVIYGLNGAGKSGFMRLFKHVSGHPYAEPIQKNVYKKSNNGNPSCIFNIVVDGVQSAIDCDLTSEDNDDYLRQLDVFDTRISGAYVSSSNSVSYEPFVFSVLKELANVAGRIDHAIKDKIESIPADRITCPEQIQSCKDATWLSSLSASSSIPKECQSWEKKDTDRVDEIKKLLDVKQVEEQLRVAKTKKDQLQSVLTELQKLENILLGEKRADVTSSYDEMATRREQFELAQTLFAQNASAQDKISVSIDAWNSLWKMGRQYYESCLHKVNGNAFAKKGSICPMCLQKIEGDNLIRFSSVDEYVNGHCSEEYTKAKQTFERKFQQLFQFSYSSKALEDILKNMVGEDILKEIVTFYTMIEGWKNQADKETAYKDLLLLTEIPVVKKLGETVSNLENQIVKLTESLNVEKQKEMQEELLHLQYRHWVFDRTGIILTIIANEKKKAKLLAGQQYLKTNRITNESNVLAEKLISEAYIERFSKELRVLAPYLKVKLEKGQSTKGKSPYKIVLDTSDKARKNPQDILSEGEQRIVALAAFFADATGRDELTPIVIDDPISSLDYNYEEAATKRIVELAKERQIIVFTHRISLLVGLSEQCEKNGVMFAERHIRGTLNGKGVSDFEEIYHGKIQQQLAGIQARIRETKKMDPYSHEYQDSCSRISQQLRICIERSVEDVLFQQMVKRFSRRIMTGKLLKMDRITAGDCQIIDAMMTKYSFGEHSQPEDSGLISFDLDETIQDIDNFLKWIKDYTKRIDAK